MNNEQLIKDRTYSTRWAAFTLEFDNDGDAMWALPLDKPYYVPGGDDVNPTLYGEVNTHSGCANPERDIVEAEVIRYLAELNHPILG
ncbi:MAG: hypothetical protein GY809_20410, partial [Planctomycetes bacterium]|nr:hypothetical protein [Planctomycetota bacterium]